MAWLVYDDGADPEESGCSIVYAHDKSEAQERGWHSDAGVSIRDSGDPVGPYDVSARRIPEADRFWRGRAHETRDEVYREAGLHWQGENVCECCNLGSTGHPDEPATWNVCSECDRCGECGHDETCPEHPAVLLASMASGVS